jgi:paraquat-inducible protein A
MTTAKELGMAACHTCDKVYPPGHTQCTRCGTLLRIRIANSVQRTWALLIASIILYIPANVYPVMSLIEFGLGDAQTILGGTINLYETGYYGIATIILVCSFVVPMAKIIGLGWLLISVQRGNHWNPAIRVRIYSMIEVIGRWSMLDIFVISILTALVRFGYPAMVIPGVAATSFGAVVILTMLAATTFDPRLIWDTLDLPEERTTAPATA